MDSEKKFLYQQVYQDIKDKITSAQYQFGDLLPSEREIGEEYHVDRTTVRKAFSLLVDEGLVEKRAGKGSVVISSNSPVSSIPAVSHKGSIAFLIPKAAVSVTGSLFRSTPNCFIILKSPAAMPVIV